MIFEGICTSITTDKFILRKAGKIFFRNSSVSILKCFICEESAKLRALPIINTSLTNY